MLLIVVMVVFQVYDVLRRFEIVVDTEQQRFLSMARSLGEQSADTLQMVDLLLREVGAEGVDALAAGDGKGLHKRLHARMTGLPQLADLLIVDSGGGILARAAGSSKAPTPGTDVLWGSAQTISTASHLRLSDVFRADSAAPVVALSRGIDGAHGELLGLAVAYLDLKYFQRRFASLELGPGAAVDLFRVDGDSIARFPAEYPAQGVAAEIAVFHQLLGGGAGVVRMLRDPVEGRERIFAVRGVPGFPLAVGASVDKAAVLAPWYVQAMHSAVRTTLLCMSIALLLWLILRELRNRERAEHSLLVQTALLDELFESAPEAIVMVDLQGRVTRVNREFVAMFGYSAPEAHGRTLAELIMPEELRQAPTRPARAADPPLGEETERIRKDGRRLRVSMLAAPIVSAGEQIASYAIFRDITERKLAEAERAKLESRLRQAAKLEAIGTMAGGIAHDFNSVLTAILSYTDMALQKAPSEAPARYYVERVLASAQRAKALVNQILTYSRSTRGKRTVVKICEVVDEALLLVRGSLPGSVELRVRLAAADARVVADPTQIHQIILNLCTNAVQAMASGGVLDVALDPIDISSDRRLSHGLLQAGRYVRLAVSDTGSGIEAELQERIFEPFFTTKQPGSGTGLGLALVHGIVTELGGAIQLASRRGMGSAFDLYLPRAPAATLESSQAEVPLPRGSGERILLVEDEKPLMLLGEEMLAALNFEPAGFTQAADALAEFRMDPWRFDLAIVDHLMPDLDGIDLARELRRARADIPVVLLSGYTGPLLSQEAVAAGIDRILTKPLELEALARALMVLLTRTPAS